MTLTRRRLFLASTGFVIAGTAGIALPPWRHAQAEGAEVDASDFVLSDLQLVGDAGCGDEQFEMTGPASWPTSRVASRHGS